ncbi:hypothetical protein GPECTOR_44g41 [Gonium pectorale]|uniref:Uncharacterized protein n=1 Tax=Gonium pectorale TaxID=33097 RepID=A0A150G951_GONPE|nr:hypothetical protein GPECTOR_44g41 [Gonium pectorale]|eukprot:KXZ46364.1 hypothetical protein GPECTOR_44g41 [Gonium pectorale]
MDERWTPRVRDTIPGAPDGRGVPPASAAPPWADHQAGAGGDGGNGASSSQQGPEAGQGPQWWGPGQGRGPTAAGWGSDWGEVDPLTDWGGAAATASVDGAGWDSGDGAAGPRPAGGGDLDGSTGAFGGYGPAGSPPMDGPGGPQQRFAGPDPGAGPGSGPGRPGSRPADGWEERARFIQDVQYDDGYGSYGTPPYGSAGAGPRDGGAPGGASSGPAAAGPPPGAIQPSDIVLLSGRDASSILPLVPTSGQIEYYQPRSLQERIVQYMGSIGATVLLSKAALLAGPALLYPVWSPWIRAGLRNLDMYSASFAAVGLWRAQVLDVSVNGLAIGGVLLSRQPPTVSLLIGDPWVGGARASLDLPYQPRSELIRPGDSVELLVLCRDERFVAFKAEWELHHI